MVDFWCELFVFLIVLCLILYDSCYFILNDLFCVNKYSVFFVVRDYKLVFFIVDKREWSEVLLWNLLVIRFKSLIN